MPGLSNRPRERARDKSIETALRAALESAIGQAMTSDAGVTCRRWYGRRALESDEVDLVPGVGQRDRVILHSRAAA